MISTLPFTLLLYICPRYIGSQIPVLVEFYLTMLESNR